MRTINVVRSCLLSFALGSTLLLSPIFALPVDDVIEQIDSLNYEIETMADLEDDFYNQGMSYIDSNPNMNSECLEKLDQNFNGLLFQYKPDFADWEEFDPIKSRKISPNNHN